MQADFFSERLHLKSLDSPMTEVSDYSNASDDYNSIKVGDILVAVLFSDHLLVWFPHVILHYKRHLGGYAAREVM